MPDRNKNKPAGAKVSLLGKAGGMRDLYRGENQEHGPSPVDEMAECETFVASLNEEELAVLGQMLTKFTQRLEREQAN